MRMPISFIIWLTIGCALVLQIMPMPLFADSFRPNWLLMTTIYWCMALPHRFNIASVWCCGLLLDAIWGTNLGANALFFIVVCGLVLKNYQRLRSYSVWHQALLVGMLSFIYQLISYLFQRFFYDVSLIDGYYFSVFSSIVFWPWLFFLLRKVRLHFYLT
ncbi:MAG: rod shape-determining protein MreD [Gammaproteobacteria bacterium]|nr:rod shape-determining protein MreD [Gammaproteobacteria bacterium]